MTLDLMTRYMWLCSNSKDLIGERVLRFFFGHRAQHPSPDSIHRWIHMRGCHLILLMALMVKYRLSPLGVEDIIEQGAWPAESLLVRMGLICINCR